MFTTHNAQEGGFPRNRIAMGEKKIESSRVRIIFNHYLYDLSVCLSTRLIYFLASSFSNCQLQFMSNSIPFLHSITFSLQNNLSHCIPPDFFFFLSLFIIPMGDQYSFSSFHTTSIHHNVLIIFFLLSIIPLSFLLPSSLNTCGNSPAFSCLAVLIVVLRYVRSLLLVGCEWPKAGSILNALFLSFFLSFKSIH